MKVPLIERLNNKFKACKTSQKNSIVNIYTSDNKSWTIYVRLGRIVWATGGTHRFRRWYRLMDRYCSNIDFKTIQAGNIVDFLCEYSLLNVLLNEGKIERPKAISLIENIVIEVLFQILQSESKIIQVSLKEWEQQKSQQFNNPIVYINSEVTLKKSQDLWQAWCNVSLAHISPDLALLLIEPEQLKNSTDSKTYQKISVLANGKKTLRDLAFITKQDLLTLTLFFLPYVQNNIIKWQEVPDFVSPLRLIKRNQLKSSQTKNTALKRTNKVNQKLVFCVDDSPQVCHIMQQILTGSDYRFIDIQKPLEVLPKLIEHKPDLVFLDITMPITNGYEICSQIRKISNFKDIPIVILTSNDRIVDRVRAKMVGASEFLTKPIESEKILAVANRLLNTKFKDIEESYTMIEMPS